MTFLIDTNIAIHARDGTERVLDKLSDHDGSVTLSALSLAELQRGLYRDPAATALRRARLDVLLEAIPVLPFDAPAAQRYGDIVARCGSVRGRDFERLIAAHALSLGFILVTDNETDFRDIADLAVLNWLADD